jgi:site-specific DNA-methyltransferase (adenine-specific)
MSYAQKVVIGEATLYQGDCMDVLPTLQGVDFVWTDPPYNVGKDYGEGHDDSMVEVDYFAWCEQWLDMLKALTPRVSIYPPKKHLRWFWGQLPDNGLVVCPWRPSGAVRGKRIHQFAPLLLSEPKRKVSDVFFDPQVPGLGYFFQESTFGHPSYTSLDITTRVIDSHSDEGETVLDCFLGTGTTGVCCALNRRKFIGIERNSEYFALAVRRIEQAHAQGQLFAPTQKPQEQLSIAA